jgi:hypothetical protein
VKSTNVVRLSTWGRTNRLSSQSGFLIDGSGCALHNALRWRPIHCDVPVNQVQVIAGLEWFENVLLSFSLLLL